MRSIIACATLVLVGCATVPQNEGTPATVSDVVKKIKKDLDVYQKYDALAASAKPLDNECHGAVSFSISNVKIALTTQTVNTTTGNVSATLPVGSGTFGSSFSGTNEVKGTQTITFSLYPREIEFRASEDTNRPEPIDASLYPIAAGLQQLRDGLLDASQTPPCVSLTPPLGDDGKPSKDDGGTYSFGFAVNNQSQAGANIKFVIYSLGTSTTSQRQAGNTITVSFKARKDSASAIHTAN